MKDNCGVIVMFELKVVVLLVRLLLSIDDIFV